MTDHGGVPVDPSIERRFPGADRRATAAVINLFRTESLLSTAIASVLQDHDLTPASFNVLMILDGADGPLCPYEIGARRLVTRGTVTGLLDSLEKRGLIRRSPHPEDRRMLHVQLTPKGRRLLATVQPKLFGRERELLAGLSAREKDDLVRLLGKLQHTLQTG